MPRVRILNRLVPIKVIIMMIMTTTTTAMMMMMDDDYDGDDNDDDDGHTDYDIFDIHRVLSNYPNVVIILLYVLYWEYHYELYIPCLEISLRNIFFCLTYSS